MLTNIFPVKRLLLISLLLFGWIIHVYPGDKHAPDTSGQYIDDLTERLILRLYTLTKYNSLEIISPTGRMIMRPNGNTNLGIGFNFKGVGLGVSFGRPLSQSSIDKYGLTNRFDLQASLYGKRLGMDGFLQWYKGYYMANPNDFIDWDKPHFPHVRDLEIFSIGGNGFYLFNREKFSYKAAYLRNEIQKRSAGSFSAGFFFYHDMVRSDNGFLPAELPDSIRIDFDLKEFDATSVGLSVGYQHTFVIDGNFFINFQFTPGIGYRRLAARTLDGGSGIINKAAWQVLGRMALGYEFEKFYAGAMASIILRSFKYKGYEVDLGTEQFRITIGKRFDVSRRK
jgi:hypothetical protein